MNQRLDSNIEINSAFTDCLVLLLSQEEPQLETWSKNLLTFFSKEITLNQGSFFLSYKQKDCYQCIYTTHSETLPEILKEDIQKQEAFILDALYPSKLQQYSGNSYALILPLYQDQDYLLGFLRLDFSEVVTNTILGLLYTLHPFINQSFKQLYREFLQVKEIEVLKAMNNSMEVSQQTMQEDVNHTRSLHKQLTASLQYAKRIQEASLPTDQVLSSTFEEYFILHKPRNIVSGDFYWCSRLDYTFLAVVDCTGHGVPGALMSMMANTLLNEIVNIQRETDPAIVLLMLHKGVEDILKQKENDNVDGMDIGLCRLHRDDDFKLNLIFAGAKNSLFVHHQSELVQLKGDRISLGGQQHIEDIRFTNQKMMLDDGDTLYLTTDGYIDAANEYREKIGMQRFQTLLTDHAHLPMVEQGDRLQEVLNTHQRGTTQRDDITIVGVKV